MAPPPSCPICRKLIAVETATDNLFRPFCSQRCKLIDLAGWLDGTYRISRPLAETDLDGADNFLGLRKPGQSDDDNGN